MTLGGARPASSRADRDPIIPVVEPRAACGLAGAGRAQRSITEIMQPNEPDETAPRRHAGPTGGVSVVMVSFWTGPVLDAVIESVLAPDQAGLLELVVVDNGNPPEVTARLARRAQAEPRLALLTGHGNVGFARGCNIGSRRARGRYLLLLNPDCRLSAGAVPALIDEAGALGEHWMLGARVLDPDGSDQRGSRRALLTPLTALVEALRLDRLAPGRLGRHRLNHHDAPLPRRTTRVPVVSGACMMLPAATFRAVGGMDEGYFLHVDDLDLCLRLHRGGIPVHFAPHVEAVHHSGSSRADPVRIEWYKARGFLRYFRVHYRGLRWSALTAAVAAAVLIRFGIKVVRCRARSAWRRWAPRGPRPGGSAAKSGAPPPRVARGPHMVSSARGIVRIEGRASEPESAVRS